MRYLISIPSPIKPDPLHEAVPCITVPVCLTIQYKSPICHGSHTTSPQRTRTHKAIPNPPRPNLVNSPTADR